MALEVIKENEAPDPISTRCGQKMARGKTQVDYYFKDRAFHVTFIETTETFLKYLLKRKEKGASETPQGLKAQGYEFRPLSGSSVTWNSSPRGSITASGLCRQTPSTGTHIHITS